MEETPQPIQIQVDTLDAVKIFVVILGANVIAFSGVQAYVEHKKKKQTNKMFDRLGASIAENFNKNRQNTLDEEESEEDD